MEQTTRSKILYCIPCWWQKGKCGVTFGIQLNLPFYVLVSQCLNNGEAGQCTVLTGHPQLKKMCCLGPQDHRANVEELKEERPVALCSDITESLSLLLFLLECRVQRHCSREGLPIWPELLCYRVLWQDFFCEKNFLAVLLPGLALGSKVIQTQNQEMTSWRHIKIWNEWDIPVRIFTLFAEDFFSLTVSKYKTAITYPSTESFDLITNINGKYLSQSSSNQKIKECAKRTALPFLFHSLLFEPIS